MQFLALGLIALPFAAVAYALFARLHPLMTTSEPLEPGSASKSPLRRKTSQARNDTVRKHRLGLPPRLAIPPAVVILAALTLLSRQYGQPGHRASVGTLVPPPAPLAFPPPTSLPPLAQFGAAGTGSGQFQDGRDIAMDASGNLYVADLGNHRVAKFNRDGTAGGEWTATAQGNLVSPVALVVVGVHLVVADNETGLLHEFDLSGQPVAGFEHALGLYRPRGLAAGPGGLIYVADTGNNRVVKVAPDGSPAGELEVKGAKLDQPTGLAFDEQGDIYVAEPDAKRLEKFDKNGNLLGQWFLAASNTITPPHLLWLHGQGLLVTQPDQNALALYSPAGTVTHVWNASGSGPGASPILQKPLEALTTENGMAVWVLSSGNSSILELALPPAN